MDQLFAQLLTGGPLGIFVVFLIIDRQRTDKLAAGERARRDKLDAEERARRDKLDEQRIEADKEMASSLATLAAMIGARQR